MENVSKFLLIAAAIALAAILVTVAFKAANTGKNQANQALNSTVAITSEYSEPEKLAYDGIKSTGTDVIATITKFVTANDCAVVVHTKKTTNNASGVASTVTNWYGGAGAQQLSCVYTGSSMGDGVLTSEGILMFSDRFTTDGARKPVTYTAGEDPTKPAYINPQAIFTSHIYRSTDGMITLIEFVQD